jgi:lysozyme
MSEQIKDPLIEQIKKHEGFREHVYQCTAGCDTIGYGYNLDANPLALSNYEIVGFRNKGISKEQAETILKIHVAQIETTLTKQLHFFESLNEARQAVLINMCFNMGPVGLFAFKNTLQMIGAGDYEGAASNMLKSKWATQVKGRATELATQMQTGKFK